MNFVIDAMLGKLARWLRIMGHDVKYSIHLDDAELLSVVRVEKRVLLTRDLELYKQAITMGSEAYYVEGTTEPDRLAELAQRFNLPLEINLEKSRCPKCNAKIRLVNKKEIENRVEKNTHLHYEIFWKCPECEAVYWQGAHWTNIIATLETAQQKLKENKGKIIPQAI